LQKRSDILSQYDATPRIDVGFAMLRCRGDVGAISRVQSGDAALLEQQKHDLCIFLLRSRTRRAADTTRDEMTMAFDTATVQASMQKLYSRHLIY
jgi:hypothetical protein